MEYLQTVLLLIILAAITPLTYKNYRAKLHKTPLRSVLLDSSALIDGRILEVARNGFVPGTLVIPSSVLREMQYLADNGDADKRSRARHGLDIVKELQELPNADVQILNDGLPGDGGVDERLVSLSKQNSADLLTLDFNLNKVAQAEGVQVLNINQLAQSLRMSYLPGEKRSISLVQKGQDARQAVGYLEDGTMVVVEDAGKEVGQSVEVEFTRALQTQAGKMMFAKKVKTAHNNHKQKASTISSSKPSQVKSYHAKPKSRNNRRSPEDSLVELANQQ